MGLAQHLKSFTLTPNPSRRVTTEREGFDYPPGIHQLYTAYPRVIHNNEYSISITNMVLFHRKSAVYTPDFHELSTAFPQPTVGLAWHKRGVVLQATHKCRNQASRIEGILHVNHFVG